jgi:CRP/FNR family cyclic AMP-dependent transcriptional regulator
MATQTCSKYYQSNQDDMLQHIKQTSLFHGIEHEQVVEVSRFIQQQHYQAGEYLIRPNRASKYTYIILTGTVKVQVTQANGRNVILAILGPDQVIGQMSLGESFDPSGSVVTLERCSVLQVNQDHLDYYLRNIPQLQANLLGIVSNRLRLAHEQIQALSSLNVDGRLARQILIFSKQYGLKEPNGIMIPIRLSQDDLAELVGASRMQVSRVMGDYKRQGLLSANSRLQITIHNLEALEAYYLSDN